MDNFLKTAEKQKCKKTVKIRGSGDFALITFDYFVIIYKKVGKENLIKRSTDTRSASNSFSNV